MSEEGAARSAFEEEELRAYEAFQRDPERRALVSAAYAAALASGAFGSGSMIEKERREVGSADQEEQLAQAWMDAHRIADGDAASGSRDDINVAAERALRTARRGAWRRNPLRPPSPPPTGRPTHILVRDDPARAIRTKAEAVTNSKGPIPFRHYDLRARSFGAHGPVIVMTEAPLRGDDPGRRSSACLTIEDAEYLIGQLQRATTRARRRTR